MKNQRLTKEDCVLVVVDYQERLMPVMAEKEAILDKVKRAIKGATVLDIQILVTQQYTRGLGNTLEEISSLIEDFSYFDKKSFSVLGQEEFCKALEETKRKTVILAGIESHICISQSALDLMEKGYNVFLLKDCCSSRNLEDHKTAVMRMREAGAIITSTESVLMELIGGAEDPNFKAISKIIV